MSLVRDDRRLLQRVRELEPVRASQNIRTHTASTPHTERARERRTKRGRAPPLDLAFEPLRQLREARPVPHTYERKLVALLPRPRTRTRTRPAPPLPPQVPLERLELRARGRAARVELVEDEERVRVDEGEGEGVDVRCGGGGGGGGG